jgi:hypothetical protein
MTRKIILFSVFLILIPFTLWAATPVLFFSDLLSGPNAGWSAALPNRGAAVTIWGENLGTAGAGVYLTCCGEAIQSTDSGIAEWNKTGTANGVARGMGRITFWLNSSMSGSAGITVTTPEGTSNILPFAIRGGDIYFISTTGNNGAAGSITAPWKDLYMAAPEHNASVTAGTTIYVRSGTYTTGDPNESAAFIWFSSSSSSGTSGNEIALVAYPGEVPTANMTGHGSGLTYSSDSCTAWGSGTGCQNYWIISKMKMTNGAIGMNVRASHVRIVGNWFESIHAGGWSGILDNDFGSYNNFYGNYFHGCGNDSGSDGSYTHHIYTNGTTGSSYSKCTYVNMRYNEFANAVNSSYYGGLIDIRSASNIDISDNYFHDCNDQPLYTSAEGGSVTNIYFYNNIASNNNIMPGATDPANGEYCLHLNDLDSTSLVYNNTFYRCPINSYEAVLGVYGAFTSHSTVTSKNNIVYGSSESQPALYIESSGTFNSAYDLYYTVTTPSGSGVTVSNVLTTNPLFVSHGSDFHLQETSPCRDTGTSNTLVTTDFDGLSRPQGTAYDRGAYEYIVGGGNNPPSAPANLRIISP